LTAVEEPKAHGTCNGGKRYGEAVTVEEPKARGTCNGGKRYGEAVTLAETYAACVEQTTHRLTWARYFRLHLDSRALDTTTVMHSQKLQLRHNHSICMRPDAQFREWRTECLGRPPLGEHRVIPVLKTLQRHAESPRLWDKHIQNSCR